MEGGEGRSKEVEGAEGSWRELGGSGGRLRELEGGGGRWREMEGDGARSRMRPPRLLAHRSSLFRSSLKAHQGAPPLAALRVDD